jgi:pimeloyl-ACP methyl ester carboxylesterase
MLATIAAEFPKFTAPLLFIHGRWCTATVWRGFAGYFAHLGWTCHTLTLRGHGVAGDPSALGRACFVDHLEDVRGAMATCESTPVLLGHDLGGLLALHCAATAHAIVALAPLVPRPLARGRRLGLLSRLAMRRSLPLPPPTGLPGLDFFGQDVPGGATPESRRLARQIAVDDLRFPPNPSVPKLLIVGQADAVCLPGDVARLATYAGATFCPVEGARHALPWEPGWEKRVVQIHRWLVQQLGEPLLIAPEEEED